MEQLLRKLCNAKGVSGNESNVASLIKKEMKGVADSIESDSIGNVMMTKKGTRPGPTMLISAHMDEVGGMVRYIDEKGFIFFDSIGHQSPSELLGSRVHIGPSVTGIIQIRDIPKNEKLELKDLYIDVGAKNKEDLEDLNIKIGSPITRMPSFEKLLGSRYVSKSFDNRAGLCAMLEAFQKVISFPGTLIAVASSQEEVGTRGAKVAAQMQKPDIAIAVDVTFAYDTPQKKEARDINTVLGGGPAMTLKDDKYILSPKMREFIEGIAKSHKITLQYDISKGGTDASPIHTANGGIPTVALLIPLRYMHTGNEIIDINDIKSLIDLLVAIIEEADTYEY